jgi:hypothetical protein
MTTTHLFRACALAIVTVTSGAWTVSVAGIGGLPSPLDSPIVGSSVESPEPTPQVRVTESDRAPTAPRSRPTTAPVAEVFGGPASEPTADGPASAVEPDGTDDAGSPTAPDDRPPPSPSEEPSGEAETPREDEASEDEASDEPERDNPLDGLLGGGTRSLRSDSR